MSSKPTSRVRREADRAIRSRKVRRENARLLGVLAVFVSLAVAGITMQAGRAMVHEERVLDCPVATDGSVAHTHDDSCYDADGNLVCRLPEVEAHVHDDSCYTEEQTLTCGMEEGDGAHHHDDSCYDEEGSLACELEESEGHVHTDECYEVTRTLTCGKEEITKEHVHGQGCFRTVVIDDEEADPQDESADTESQDEVEGSGEAADVTDEIARPAQSFQHEFVDDKKQLQLRVSVEAPEGALPEGTTMRAEWVDTEADENGDVQAAIDDAVAKQTEGRIDSVQAVDITFLDAQGVEVEPAVPVTVTMTSPQIADAAADSATSPLVVHVESEREAIERSQELGLAEVQIESQVVDPLSDRQMAKRDIDAADSDLVFDAEKFSVYAVVYTVDFHYNVDGKAYDSSITGGGFVSFRSLVEALGVVDDDPATSVNEIQELVGAVEWIDFSDPSLVSISRVDADTTVGAIKDVLGLECEYSSELTDAQIAEINAQQVAAGDWALISLRPFSTEETLTVTMKNGDVWTVRVTDAQISANVLAANGERFRITVTYGDEAGIPDGASLAAEEILEGSALYDEYFEDTVSTWEDANKEGYVSFCRFFDIEIRKDGQKIEPQAPVEVDIKHEDGFVSANDESLSVIHFADSGTEIIDDINKNENGTEVAYEQDSFSVIGTVSTVKDSGWPTTNGQYVLVLQDGDDYYALKQDGTLQKVRFFNNTVSFIGAGTTTTDYINDYLWYVVSSGNRGKISDEYTEYNATPTGQTFIDLNGADMFSGTSRQLQIRDGKIYCNGPIPGSSGYTQYTMSASGGQLSRVPLTSDSASPAFFANVDTFTANDNETDLFTQVEVESIIEKWKEQKTQTATYDKTAEVYDYENRVYQVDITASSADYEVSPSIALEFVVDASRSMFFPTSVTEVATFSGTNASGVRDWINAHGNRNQVYFVIQDKNGKATQYAIFYEGNQWRWVDASVYNPPDDVANGGTQNSRQSGLPLSDWSYGSLDDGKIYTTGITGTSNGTYGERKTWISRIEYLKQCVRVAAQVIHAVDDNAQIGLIGFNANTTDYGTYGKNEQETLLSQLDGISLAGGTNHQGGLQKAIDKYNKGTAYYAEHYAGRKHVVVLVTDGAPNATGVNWTTIGNTATTLKNQTDDFGGKTELYTMGLSLSNVGSNQSNLFNVSSGAGYTYAGEDAAQIINAVTKMVDGIFVQANLVADVTDVIDPAFYPVDSASGLPLAEDEWINLSGRKVNAGASDAAGQIKKDATTGNWYVEWKNQSIDWPTTDSHGAVVEPGWHGTVFVKAKEDFLGGNGISTNAAGSGLEATKYKVRGDATATVHDMPEGDHTATFETPYVNIDELDITKNDTEWSVYLGTKVNPLAAVKELWNNVKVREVVTQTDSDHRTSSDGALTYAYTRNAQDNRAETNGREEFPITDLGIELTDDDWADLIAGNSKILDYNAYDHTKVGTIMVSLTQQVVTGEKNLSESPHDTTVTGDEVEKYTLTVSYRPAGANISNWHTGSFGLGVAGTRAGNIRKDNTHIINVHAKNLQITKVGLDDQVLTGAKFALYRTARDGETDDNLTIDERQYHKVAELDTSSTGMAIKNQLEQLNAGEQYYLVETQAPDGYNAIPPIPVTLQLTDVFTPKPGTATQATKPDSGMYDWAQNSLIVIDTAGVKRTDADNLQDLTHSGNANTDTETIYYRITNNPGVALPSTGGFGTSAIYLLGVALVGLGAASMVMQRRRQAA